MEKTAERERQESHGGQETHLKRGAHACKWLGVRDAAIEAHRGQCWWVGRGSIRGLGVIDDEPGILVTGRGDSSTTMEARHVPSYLGVREVEGDL